MNLKRLSRGALWILAATLGLELLYVLIANAVLVSGVIQRAASKDPQALEMSWDWAFSPWPGRAYVKGFKLRMQNPVVQFRLTVESAHTDVVLRDLLRRQFHASFAHAERVTYRMLAKVDAVEGQEQRLDAFPILEGFGRPALKPDPMPPLPTQEELDAAWAVQIDDTDVDVSELWFLEYRYFGRAHVRGGFSLQPLRTLWVGPAVLELDGGALTAGPHVLASAFNARLTMALAPFQLLEAHGLQMLQTLSASVHFETPLESLGAAALYAQGLQAEGTGRLAAHLQIEAGRLLPGSTLELALRDLDAKRAGYRFAGSAEVKLEVKEHSPIFNGSFGGALSFPIPGSTHATVDLSDFRAELVLAEAAPAPHLQLERLTTQLGSARIRDASAISSLVGTWVPVVGPAVLGSGPLLASANARITPAAALVRLERVSLGSASFAGAAIARDGDWKGSMAGKFGLLPLGLELRGGKVKGVPFASPGWLAASLREVGITPELDRGTP